MAARNPIHSDPYRRAIMDPFKLGHLRDEPVRDMWDLSKWAWKMKDHTSFGAHVDGMAKWGRMNTMDGQAFARLTAHFPNAEFEEIARVPYEINELLWKMHPDLFEDQERLEAWLRSEAGNGIRVEEHLRRPFSANSLLGRVTK